MVFKKHKLVYLYFGFLIGCSGNVAIPPTAINSSIQLMAENSSLSLLSNSTQSQNSCAATNSVVIQMALSGLSTFYCRDLSILMNSVKLGAVCTGGVTIQPLNVNSSAQDCHNITLCGQKPTSTVVTAQRIDGSTVQQLTFSNLPWGCAGDVQASKDPKFPSASTQEIQFQILPPSCPYCSTSSSFSCQTCASTPAGSTLIAGQIVPNTCTSGACSSCNFTTSTGSQTIAHQGTSTFYTSPVASCGATCGSMQITRVCNNGTWLPAPDSGYSTQCQELPKTGTCISTASIAANLNLALPVKSTGSSILAAKTNKNLATSTSATATCAICQSGGCTTCNTVSGASGYLLFTSSSVPNGSSCSSNCEVCQNGLFQGSSSYQYPSCQVLGTSCSATALSTTITNGDTQTFYAQGSGGCNPITLQCANGQWFDSSVNQVAQGTVNLYASSCQASLNCTTKGGVAIPNGSTQQVFSTNVVSSSDSCFNHQSSVGCQNGVVTPADPGPTYQYVACTIGSCPNPVVSGQKIPAGSSINYYSLQTATCSQGTAYCNQNMITATCPASGGTATLSQPASGTTASQYTYTTCSPPASCSTCLLSAIDANGASQTITLGLGGSQILYSTQTATNCSAISQTFSCKSSGSGTVLNPSSTAGFLYSSCSGKSDQGLGGGTGGGTGNGNGPGSAIKLNSGAGGGGGGGGMGCLDATTCRSNNFYSKPGVERSAMPCLLPWPNNVGEIEFYGSFSAFSLNSWMSTSIHSQLLKGTVDTVCVNPTNTFAGISGVHDSCSYHRQIRTCHQVPNLQGSQAVPVGLTGPPDYKYPNCVESTSCP